VVVFGLILAGCGGLRPDQEALLDRYEEDLLDLKADAAAIEKRVEEAAPLVKDVVAAIEEDRLPVAEGTALIADIRLNMEADRAAALKAREDIAALSATIADMKKADIPWWAYVRSAAPAVLTLLVGIAGGYLPSAKHRRALELTRDAMISGIELAGDKPTKETVHANAVNAGVEGELNEAVRRMTGRG
jgi:hypothetical protein